MTPAVLMVSPAGRPVAVIVLETAVPAVPVWAPGLVTVTVSPAAPACRPAMPFGVPQPVGPSKPVPAVHRYAGEQLPSLPVVTSKKLAVWVYTSCAGLAPALPARAYIAATIGEEAL